MTRNITPLAVAVAAMLGTATMAAYADQKANSGKTGTTTVAATTPSASAAAATAPTPPPPPPPPPSAPTGAPTPPAAPAKPLVAPPGVAATVNGENISTNEVKDLAYQMAGPNAVSQLIDFKLIDDEAAKQHVTATQAELDAKKNEIRERLKPQTLEDAMRERHMSMSFLEANLRHNIELEKLAGSDIKAPAMLHIRHILIKVASPGMAPGAGPDKPHTDAEAKALMTKIQGELKAGKKFEDLAKQYSEDPSNKDKGGDLGIVNDNTPFDPNFLKAAMALKKGEITKEPVKSFYGYHLIECVSTSADHPKDEDTAYGDAEKQWRTQQVQMKVPAFLQSLRAKAQIVNYIGQ